jgi:hypothetical protein
MLVFGQNRACEDGEIADEEAFQRRTDGGIGRAIADPARAWEPKFLLDLTAISAREYHFWSLYTSVMLTFEHCRRRIFTRHAAWDLITLRIETLNTYVGCNRVRVQLLTAAFSKGRRATAEHRKIRTNGDM